MKPSKNSDVTSEITVVTPEFSLLRSITALDTATAEAFAFADKKERRILFEMRRFIHAISSSESSQTYTMTEVKNYLGNIDIPYNIRTVFPGNIDGIDIPPDSVEKITSIADNITISLRNPYSTTLIKHVESQDCPLLASFNILTDRRISADTASHLSKLYKKGIDLTLCNKQNILNSFTSADIGGVESFDVFEGMLTIPGKTVVTCIPIEISYNDEYPKIKGMIREKINAEISRRFTRSAKGTLYYRKSQTDEKLYSLGLLYNKCISAEDKKIKSILCGGAEYDILNFQFCGNSGNNIVTLRTAKNLSAACRYLDGLYPLKLLPSFIDFRRAERKSDLPGIIKEHTSICQYMSGGCVLELDIGGTDLFKSNELLASFISDFFYHGGMMLRLIGGESFCDNK